MKKLKSLSIILAALVLIFIIPNISKAAEKQTYHDETQNVDWEYELDESENVVKLRLKTTTFAGAINIPDEISEKPVVSLAGDTWTDGAFSGCTGLTGVTIPSSVATIGENAFNGCTGLKTVTIPNSVTKIGARAFRGCSGLTSITLPNNLIEIGNSAFDGCSGLKNITIPNTVVKIGTFSFSGCSGLKSIVVPNSVTTIGTGAFSRCSGLTSVTLSNKISVIEQNTFSSCTSLKSLIIPDSVTTIRSGNFGTYSAFDGCTNLEKILIPDSVTTIEDKTFSECKKLTIYGNDGMKSKEYAEENDITFDYIANWDKADSGADITPPTVKSIQVPYTSVLSYYDSNSKMYVVPTGKQVTINVNFSEEVLGKTAPTLTIKFGSGKNIELTNGTIQGDKIIYTYTIKSTDKGIMTAVELKGGDVKDTAGNSATLSCPTLKVEIVSSNVYANGTTTDSESGSTGTGSGSTDTGSGSGSQNGTTQTPQKDDTTVQGKLPQTGITYLGIVIAIAMVAIGVVSFKKYKNYKI